MPPSERRQDKNSSGEFVTYAHFDTFLEEFRSISGGLGNKIDGVSDKITQMQIKLSGVDKDISTIQQQSQGNAGHTDVISGRVRVLEEERTVRGALQAQATALGQPARTIKDKVIETMTTAVVLGALAVGYNVIRDSMVKDAPQPSAHVAPPAPPASALPPAHTVP
jgi:hypothetical protein